MKTRNVVLPERDVQRRKVLGMMLDLPKSAWDRLTCEDMELLCIRKGYLKEVDKNEM